MESNILISGTECKNKQKKRDKKLSEEEKKYSEKGRLHYSTSLGKTNWSYAYQLGLKKIRKQQNWPNYLKKQT
jgi:hypothetical protein